MYYMYSVQYVQYVQCTVHVNETEQYVQQYSMCCDVTEAPNSHFLLYFIQHHILFNQNNNEQERDLWGARESRLCAFELSFVYDSVNYEDGMIEVAVIITYQYCCCVVRTVECNFYGLPSQALFCRESKTNLFVHNRNLTDNYRKFTFIRTYFSSSETTTTQQQ